MGTLRKLTPNQDLQCYFRQPSAVAALSATSAGGFTVSGSWREQFDWAVVEWNRDNVFEHPVFRNLPDGDLSGLKLSYQETRSNCIPLDSTLYATVDWPFLRVWADPGTGEQIYWVPLKDHASAVAGAGGYGPASATFQLQGTPVSGDYVELACDGEHYTYQFGDDLEYAVQAVTDAVNSGSLMTATRDGAAITVKWKDATSGANANRTGIYGNASGLETWQPGWQLLTGGTSPSAWQIDLDFGNLMGYLTSHPKPTDQMVLVPTNAIRKLRWTWAADLQPGAFVRSDFAVNVTNWTVTGSNRDYSVAGPGSWRVENDDSSLSYTGLWTNSNGNYSGGSISYATSPGTSVAYSFQSPQDFQLYLGTRRAADCSQVSIQVDKRPPQIIDLAMADEDVLVRIALGNMAANTPHSVKVTHDGPDGSFFYFDFLELALATTELPTFAADPQTTLATDWDTLHSQALAPERTAWLIQALGFTGRANHYAGALWFYELYRPGQQYASAALTFSGTPEFGKTTQVSVGETTWGHVNLAADTRTSLAKAFELLINEGATGVWAQANQGVLTIMARAMGSAANGQSISADTGGSTSLQVTFSGPLEGGMDGPWLTDLTAMPRMNRAARDWSSSFCAALKGYGIDVTASFSTELGNGDPSTATGIAQRYPDGSACNVNTPALQTNFSPTSLAYWQQVYLEMANTMAGVGLQPYLQFGEVQWWYFCPPTHPANGNWKPIPNGGMPFYDDYTTSTFQTQYRRPMHVFMDPSDNGSDYPDECSFLPKVIGDFTTAIMAFVRQTQPGTRFEVLYPPDTNNAVLSLLINLPNTWTPANLDCFKTENFTYTGNRDLNKALEATVLPMFMGFQAANTAHLVGIGDYTTPWSKECRTAKGLKVGSVVLFALDQCCLIGYGLPLSGNAGRSLFMGA